MNKVLSAFCALILIYLIVFSAFSFNIDGVDSGIEWDGSSIYTLVDGESNCGVNFGLVKVKYDYETYALYLCFHFSDPDFTSDNLYAGISLSVDNNSPFQITSSDGFLYKDIIPHSFDSAIIVNDTKGATCEIRVGFKSGLPEVTDCSVRFIDSQGFYSNYYNFRIVNEMYEPYDKFIVSASVDNNDPANYRTSNLKTSKNKITSGDNHTIKTSPPYSYTRRTKNSTTVKLTEHPEIISSKPIKTKKETVKVYYYEKEVYISNVYISESASVVPTTVLSVGADIYDEIAAFEEIADKQDDKLSLSKGTKYKKAVSCVGLALFITLAFVGVYSAKKGKNTDK